VELDRALTGPTGPPRRSLDGRDRVHHSLQQHRVVGVGGRQAGGQGGRHGGRPAAGTWSRACSGRWGSGRSGRPPLGAHAQRVQAGPGPVKLALPAELVQQLMVELLPYASALPVAQPSPAGDRADRPHPGRPALRAPNRMTRVQRHHGLPGARAALDHQHLGVIEPDDLVLLGLDRRHYVGRRLAARVRSPLQAASR
jgi:hypothetical protein